jgi:hypothetical protein
MKLFLEYLILCLCVLLVIVYLYSIKINKYFFLEKQENPNPRVDGCLDNTSLTCFSYELMSCYPTNESPYKGDNIFKEIIKISKKSVAFFKYFFYNAC